MSTHPFRIPQTYEEWRHCITVICRQAMTKPFIEERIKALHSASDDMTRKFIQLYGDPQRLKTLEWFERARREF